LVLCLLTVFAASAFAQPITFVLEFGTPGSGNGQFSVSTALAVDAGGDVYVADAVDHRVQRFDAAGAFKGFIGNCATGTGCVGGVTTTGFCLDCTVLGASSTGNGQFNDPRGLNFDSLGNLYVVGRQNNRVQKFSPTGIFLGWMGSCFDDGGSGVCNLVTLVTNGFCLDCTVGVDNVNDGGFREPFGIAFDSIDDFYVTDNSKDDYQKFDKFGNFLFKSIGFGSGNGQLIDPKDVAVDAGNNFYIVDASNRRIQKFASDNTFIGWFGNCVGDGGSDNCNVANGSTLLFCDDCTPTFISGLNDGQFDRPTGLDIDDSGSIFVAGSANHRVQKFAATGAFLAKFGKNGGDGSSGALEGEFNVASDVATFPGGNLFVMDSLNDRVQKFSDVPVPGCGNNVIDVLEVCDGVDLAGNDCTDFGFTGGTLSCAVTCDAFVTTACTNIVCGNNVKEAGEVCDGTDLVGQSCIGLGFDAGVLGCQVACGAFDTTACSFFACGNNIQEGAETCDGTDLTGQSCITQGFALGGALACVANCGAFDSTACLSCGDGLINGLDVCDGANLNGQSCVGLGFASGVLVCNANCLTFNTAACVPIVLAVGGGPAPGEGNFRSDEVVERSSNLAILSGEILFGDGFGNKIVLGVDDVERVIQLGFGDDLFAGSLKFIGENLTGGGVITGFTVFVDGAPLIRSPRLPIASDGQSRDLAVLFNLARLSDGLHVIQLVLDSIDRELTGDNVISFKVRKGPPVVEVVDEPATLREPQAPYDPFAPASFVEAPVWKESIPGVPVVDSVPSVVVERGDVATGLVVAQNQPNIFTSLIEGIFSLFGLAK